jgi:hypothetical protein
MTSSRSSMIFSLITGSIVALAFIAHSQLSSSAREIQSSPSPDGKIDAVLIEVTNSASDAHGYRVCFRPARSKLPPGAVCADWEVAYLSGVPSSGGLPDITLAWIGNQQLNVRYADASSATLYRRLFSWPSTNPNPRYYFPNTRFSVTPILVKLVKTGATPGIPQAAGTLPKS